MILETVSNVPSRDISRFAWSGLHRYQNVSYVTELICNIHEVSIKYKENVKKQSVQIRQCLIQAHEYHKASSVVSLSTKPLLLYYSIMSLALAEILFKQSGGSSLDKARGQNAHHGLLFSGAMGAPTDSTLNVSAAALVAKPHEQDGGKRFGTFELWHRSSRETPAGGESKVNYGGVANKDFQTILIPRDENLSQMPTKGVSLADCYRSLPCMATHLNQNGMASSAVRAICSRENHERSGLTEMTCIIHPTSKSSLDAVYEKIRISAGAFEQFQVNELQSGCILKYTTAPNFPSSPLRFPNCTQISTENTWFFGENDFVNEFGLFYISLYILGNYARYFPDRWMIDVDKSSPLALSALELIAAAEERVPLLALSEMSRTFYVPD